MSSERGENYYLAMRAAEKRVAQALAEVLGSLEGLQYFEPQDFPRGYDAAVNDQWTFSFERSAYDDDFHRSPAQLLDVGTFADTGLFIARRMTRDDAMRTRCYAASIFPYSGGNVQQAQLMSASLDGVTAEIITDTADGAAGQQRIWEVRIEILVIYGWEE